MRITTIILTALALVIVFIGLIRACNLEKHELEGGRYSIQSAARIDGDCSRSCLKRCEGIGFDFSSLEGYNESECICRCEKSFD